VTQPELDAEDAKLVIIARATRGRAYVPHGHGPVEGAAVRDTDGRTYSAATVENAAARLTTSALRAAVVAAASSGVRGLEAAVVVTDAGRLDDDDLAVVRELAAGAPVFVADPEGNVLARVGP
jgi:cytidine deaminase